MRAYLTTEDAAEYLGFCTNTLSNSRYTGRLAGIDAPPYIRIGGKTIRYKASDLDTWIDSNNCGTDGKTGIEPVPVSS